jgi:hypothetical protein
MKYIKVRWLHSSSDTPIWLYSELNLASSEVRKVEVYASGHMDFADRDQQSGSTSLGIEPLQSLEEIAANPEFEPVEISAEEFEAIWATARSA